MTPVIRRVALGLILVNAVTAGAALYLFQTKKETVRLLHSAQNLADRLASELVLVHEKLNEATDELKAKDGQIAAMKGELDAARSELSQLRARGGEINLGHVVVSDASRGGPADAAANATAEGAVMSVNKDYNFVIVNLGAQNGIKQGMMMSLLQDGAISAQLRVDMVDDTISAAGLVGAPRREVRSGDAVRVALR